MLGSGCFNMRVAALCLLVALALPAHGGEAERRFEEAARLIEADRDHEAEILLKALIEQHPASPEPYNNLAALYADQGRLEEARGLLERAMRTDPRYATVYDNLINLNLSISRRAYAQALRVGEEPSVTSLRTIERMTIDEPLLVAQAVDAQAAPSVEAVPAGVEAEAEPVGVSHSNEEGATEAEVAPQASVDEPDAPMTEGAAVSEAEPITVPAEAVVDSEPLDEEAEAAALLQAWASAWSAQDVTAYLAFYADEFRPRHHADRDAWEADRRRKISRPEWVKVELDELSYRKRAEKMRVTFLQRYTSGRYSDFSRKRVELVRRGDGWRIVDERTLEVIKH